MNPVYLGLPVPWQSTQTTKEFKVAVSNAEFGRQVGYHFTMASRVFGGKRLPSLDMIRKIGVVYEIPLEELLNEQEKGAKSFGPWLQARVTEVTNRRAVEAEALAKGTATVAEKTGII